MEEKFKFHLLQNDVTLCPHTWGMRDECALFYRIYYILGGEAYYADASYEKERLKKGSLYIFPVMHSYTMWHNTEDPLYVVWFHAELHVETAPELLEIPVAPDSAMHHLLKTLEAVNGKPEYFPEAEELFRVLLMLIDKEVPFWEIKSRKMQKVQDFIDEHLEEELTVQRLADYAGMERSYFSKSFKKYISLSPQQYVFAKKMNYAARLLIRGHSVKDVCRQIGYADEKAFSRAFKKYMEMPPGEYRKRHIEQP